MVSEKKIEEIASKIAEGFNPEKIILFGSYALGNPNRNSDLDFLIVKNQTCRFTVGQMILEWP
jgi:predicted nucleotidyltransferase